MKDLLDYLARSLVQDPDSVVIQQEDENETVVLRLTVAKDDMGRVIGKSGKTAKALRTVVSAAGMKADQKVRVEIVDREELEN